MRHQNYSSLLLDKAVNEFAKLPGIGYKTALRLVLHLLKQSEENVTLFGNTMIEMREKIIRCKSCNNISDTEICPICSNPDRNKAIVCIVENIRDVMALENTSQYNGVYHVLGGIISPMDGIGPADIEINSLLDRIATRSVNEIILALSTTMEGDTTNFFIYRKVAKYSIKVTTLARGVAIGDELEYTDEVTLGRSLINRMPFSV